MERKIRISIVIPAYNVEGYIKKTIDSCLNQTFDDYEIIVVDDGSKDNTGAIIDKYATENRNFRAIHQENGGVMSARLKGVEHSQGEWITFLDGDDRLPKDSLKTLYSYVGNDIDIVWGVRAYVNDNNDISKREKIRFRGKINGEEYMKIISKYPKSLHGMLFRKTLFVDPPVIDRRIVNNEDQIFNFFLSSRVRNVFGIAQVTHHYLVRSDSVSKKKYNEDYWYLLLNYLYDNFKKYNIETKYYNLFALIKTISLIRSKENYIFDFSVPCFARLRNLNYTSFWGLRGNFSLFVIKHPFNWLINISRVYPKMIIQSMRYKL